MEKQTKVFIGELTIVDNDNLNTIPYVVIDKANTESFNLLKFLQQNEGRNVRVCIHHKTTRVFSENGIVKSFNGLWSVNSVNVDDALWDLTGEKIRITVEGIGTEVADDEYGQELYRTS